MNLFRVPASFVCRKHAENNLFSYRTEFMRDRDRVLYATAFRRLSGKTQIYTVGGDDHKRNRLTHTLEVAQIARTIAKGLQLDEDLAEAIALSHDFGHTPFGHAGEEMLHKIMVPNSSFVKTSPFYNVTSDTIKKRFELEANSDIKHLNYAFGFKHNLQSLRVCAALEDSYRDGNGKNIGLNLTNYTLYGMKIHSKLKYKNDPVYPNYDMEFYQDILANTNCKVEAWSFEAYIVAIADEFSQWHHDLEDALRGGALPLGDICKTIMDSLGKCLTDDDKNLLHDIEKKNSMDRKHIADLSHIVVNTLVNDLVQESNQRFETIKKELEEQGVTDPKMLFSSYEKLHLSYTKDAVIASSDRISSDAFEGIIKKSVHHSRNVERMNAKGQYIIRKLFEAYHSHPQQLPDGPILHVLVDSHTEGYEFLDKAKEKGMGPIRVDFDRALNNPNIFFQCLLMRRICDHIASMTDRYAIEEYNNLYG